MGSGFKDNQSVQPECIGWPCICLNLKTTLVLCHVYVAMVFPDRSILRAEYAERRPNMSESRVVEKWAPVLRPPGHGSPFHMFFQLLSHLSERPPFCWFQ
jgi:hypothetical protein